ncbi:double-strand break repair helicase AddA [Erythrobacter sp. F6033]|uniref:double-strand break repair helicase AddA n=1 Tax=Erythrobacter sp. F6033 TaxID=2926401 RepID=UPI001FF291D1|nr:double-strand break repair helicase AddA [Erythrobacter sp. F6033]MCK0128580.1 double-strand break repair helicase AddA [Erythrobacter sp. F6033]
MSGEGKVYPLAGEQLSAANPEDNVWLSASAGTGKTQVLSARVLRLLLRPDVDPSEILCLTFTKAGAAEMATRINAVLARWVRLDPTKLAGELSDLGADIGPKTQERARTLFAQVLDCPGGGLRIDTIHAFSQWLLANFPEEANLPPGAQPMEDRTRELLSRDVLTEMLSEARRTNDTRVLDAVTLFTTAKDPGALHYWLMRCAKAEEMWEGPTAWQSPMDARVRTLLEIPSDADAGWAYEGLGPDTFPDDHLLAMIPALEDWGTKTADKCLAFLREWLTLNHAARIDAVSRFKGTLLKADGTPSLQIKKPRENDPGFADSQEMISQAVLMVEERKALLDLAEFLTAALEVGRAFAVRWQEAKRRESLLDFDDLIRRAAVLLKDSVTADWIRYKLDRQFDHILIDEAQDTNEAQWDIVYALIDDFFSGDGASGDRLRTIFTVGDYKQAIFGFQGTSPENFARAKGKVAKAIQDARESAAELRDGRRTPGWQDLDLGRSFRTSKPVLDFVNRAIALIGHEEFGLGEAPLDHIGAARPGLVTQWKPVTSVSALEEDGAEERDWLPAHDTLLAEKIAEQVRRWVKGDEPFVLAKSEPRKHASAGDIMVLVRKRGALAAQIVAKLHAKGVAVAGVDRLRLGAPLAVKDLMAALRFATQPLDDLSLANLLSSPLIGWSQDDLLAHVPREKNVSLWKHLRGSDDPMVAASCETLKSLLARADYQTPQSLLAWLLTGPWRGREKLIARLGREANDPIDELVNAAFAFESAHTPSLVGFIEWFDASNEDLKRDADGAGGQVRVMTVHGSKGLQAPIVILADATGAPGQGGELELADLELGTETARKVPLPSLAKEQKRGRVEEAEAATDAASMQEHWRLLYVAMTRAEEALFIGGSLGPRDEKNGLHEDSWYARLENAFAGDEIADGLWGMRREWGERAEPLVTSDVVTAVTERPTLPEWATKHIGPEPKPPRPLAPSSAGEELAADPPLPPDAAKVAARRGVLIHRLLERLPDIASDNRADAGAAWLARQGDDLPQETRDEMLQSALKVLETDAYTNIFSPDALAEVPLTATVGGTVITGTADRLLVSDDSVTVVDFKTTRRPPANADAIPRATVKQMAAYTAVLETIFPGKAVRAAVLYTQTPQLIEIPAVTLAAHKDHLGDTQQSFAPLDIE